MEGHGACPFCGGRRLQVRPVWESYRFVACLSCRAAGPVARSDEKAWEAWDRRLPPKDDSSQLTLF